ncbi:unnamed protein product [Prunus brigantina]
MRLPGLLEIASNPNGEVVFFTDVLKYGLRLLLRPSRIKGDIGKFEKVRRKVVEDDRFSKMLLSFGNLFMVRLISKIEKLRRKKEESKLFVYCLSVCFCPSLGYPSWW